MTEEVVKQVCADLTGDEEFRAKPYDDATGKELRPGDTLKGKITIGYGRNLSDDGCTKDEAEQWKRSTVLAKAAELERRAPWITQLDPVRQSVLLNMAFNLGVPGLLNFVFTLENVRSSKYTDAALAMRSSKWYQQVGKRAERLVEQMRTGKP